MATVDTPKTRSCETMKVHHRLLDTNPRYAEARQRIEEQTFRAMRNPAAMRPGCTKIPVVVHVVHKTAAQNISMDQIKSQIAVLNEDFRKRNADVSTVPAPFAPLAGDARLEFELATVRPRQVTPTDGVVRKQTNRDGFDSDDAVKFACERWVRRLAGRSVSQHVGVPARRRAARLRAVPGRTRRDRRRGDHAHRLSARPARPLRPSTKGERLRTRSATGSTCDTSGVTMAMAAVAAISSTTHPTRAGRTLESRPSRRLAAATAPTATCS